MSIDSFPGVAGIETVSPAFLRGLADVVEHLGWTQEHADALAGVISLESKFNPAAVNPIPPHAAGLIQWIPSEAAKLGTTTAELVKMTAEEQLPFVEAYLESRKNIAPRDVSLAILWPPAIGLADDHVISRAGEKVYDSNAGLDRNKDGTLTAGDVRAAYSGPLNASRDKPRVPVPPAPKIWPWLLGGLVVLAGGYLAWVETTGQKWDAPIRGLLSNPRDVDIRQNPTRAAWRAVRRSKLCTSERQDRRTKARQWADAPCKEELSKLQEEAREKRAQQRARTARMTPAQRRAQRDRRMHQLEDVEREAESLDYHLQQHTDLPGAAIEQAVRDFKREPWVYFRRTKASGGRTAPYEFAADDAMENVDELIHRAEQHQNRELRKLEREGVVESDDDDDEAPF